MEHETAGDPISGLKWTRKTTRKISRELKSAGLQVSANTVARLLKQLGYSLRVNRKSLSRTKAPERNKQFVYIKRQRNSFEDQGLPIVSVDTKKKELIGCFKNPGAAWAKTPSEVLDHDFRNDAEALAVPYGVFDLQANRGRFLVGTSHDTAAFAVDALVHWWTHEGSKTYAHADQILVLADNGGSNGSRVRAWKLELQRKLCDPFQIAVTVCHYPSGASKWNPIEHRLFAPVSRNWEAQPLDSLETMVKYLRTTTTATGLKVYASRTRRTYPKGVKVSDEAMQSLNLHRHHVLPQWNYTLQPAR